MICTITLYYNTGFGPSDLPDSPSLVDSMAHIDLETNYELQDSDITTTVIEATWDQVKNADYCKIKNTYFFVLHRNMLNENACELTLQVDALTSMGGPMAQTYTGGVVIRAHTTDDTLFKNVIEEDITPQKPLRIQTRHATTTGTQSRTLVGTTVSLLYPGLQERSDGGIDIVGGTDSQTFIFKGAIGTDEYSVTLPLAPKPGVDTTFIVGGVSGRIPGVCFNFLDRDFVKLHLRYLRMLNLHGAVLYCYTIPTGGGLITFRNTGQSSESELGLEIEAHTLDVDSGQPYESALYTARNKKVYAMYNQYVVQFNLSGDTQIFKAEDLYASGDTSPSFKLTCNPQPGGSLICYPSKYQGNFTMFGEHGIHGTPWRETPIAFSDPAGQMLDVADYKKQKGQIEQDYWRDYGNAGGIAAMIEGGKNFGLEGALAGGAGHLGKVIGEGLSDGRHLKNQLNDLRYTLTKKQIVAPDLSISPNTGLNNIMPESLIISHVGPDISDLALFDKYFDYYGYAMGGEVFDKKYLTGRRYCNYIQVSDVHITTDSTQYGLSMRNIAESQLNSGVRIWHVKPQTLVSNERVTS